MLTPALPAIRAWLPNRKPTLGRLLAASDNPTLTPYTAKEDGWKRFTSLLVMAPVSSTGEAAQTHLVLALGALGVTSIGLLGVQVLTLASLPLHVYFVARFIQGGIGQVVQERRVGMAVIDALVTSTLLSLGYFWAIALYATSYYVSRSMVQQTSNRYQDSMLLIASSPPRHVRVMHDTTETWVELEHLAMTDTIVVYAGEVVPVDGVVVDGVASIDQRLLTGESQPVEREAGEHVFAMTLVLSGMLYLRAEQTGTSTTSAQMGSLLNQIRSYTTLLTFQSEKIGNRYAMPMLVLSGSTMLLLGPMSALTVLCSYIGYSMRISGPLSVLNYLRLAAQEQILLKDGRALEQMHHVDTVIFDKTGTLTLEQPHVVNIYTYGSYHEHHILELAAAAESHQTHPIARAITQAAHERDITIPHLRDVSYEPGMGLQVRMAGMTLHVVSGRFLEREAISLPPSAEAVQAYCYQRGHSLVYVVLGDTVIGTIELAPTLRPEARQVVAMLQQRGKTVLIVSGDHEQPTRWLANTLGVDHSYADMLPTDKTNLITRLQQEGRTVCFVGDGINDALALKQANVSISLHGAAGLALDTAQVVLPNPDLTHLLVLFELGEHLHNRMRGNLVISIVPGIITIGGVYLLHFGLVAAYLLYYTGFAAGIANAMLPLVLAHSHGEAPPQSDRWSQVSLPA